MEGLAAASLGDRFPTFRKNVVPLYSKVTQPKKGILLKVVGCFCATLGTAHPAAQRHTSEELNPHDNSFLASDLMFY